MLRSVPVQGGVGCRWRGFEKKGGGVRPLKRECRSRNDTPGIAKGTGCSFPFLWRGRPTAGSSGHVRPVSPWLQGRGTQEGGVGTR